MQTANTIKQLLIDMFEPEVMALENESHMHAGYFEGKESHFKLTLVSAVFEGLRLVQRHQKVYGCVAELLTSNGGNIHALALHTYTPNEWQEIQIAPRSPHCISRNTI